MKKSKLNEKVEQVLESLDDKLFQQENLEKAIRLNEQYRDVKPKPFHYSIEQAIGLPSYKNSQ